MKAAVFHRAFSIDVAERPICEPGHGEALIEVRAAGICAGDLYIYLGKNPYVTYPRIGGHEISGRIVRLGPDTDGPPSGTRVVVEPFLGCGKCYPCRLGKSNCCARLEIIGVHREGGFAQFLCAPVTHLHEIPPQLTDFDAAFAEPVAIGVQACRRGAIAVGEKLLVVGAGPIGLAIIEVAQAHGAACFVADPDADRVGVARALGATPLPSGDGLLPAVMEITGGEGMPVVIEATGVASVMEGTINLVAAGGRIVIVGLVGHGVGVTFPGLDFTRKEVSILGSRASVGCFPEALRLLGEGRIRSTKMALTYHLEDAPAVFQRLAARVGPSQKGVFVSSGARLETSPFHPHHGETT